MNVVGLLKAKCCRPAGDVRVSVSLGSRRKTLGYACVPRISARREWSKDPLGDGCLIMLKPKITEGTQWRNLGIGSHCSAFLAGPSRAVLWGALRCIASTARKGSFER